MSFAACRLSGALVDTASSSLSVVDDPYDVFAPGAVKYSLRPLFRWYFTPIARQCRNADGVAYVTERALQNRYPCAAFSMGMSDVEVTHETTVAAPIHRNAF